MTKIAIRVCSHLAFLETGSETSLAWPHPSQRGRVWCTTSTRAVLMECNYRLVYTLHLTYSATQQESRFFSRVACRLVFFHRSQKTPRRHTKTFCLASTAIVHKAAYKYVCIDDAYWGRLKYVTYHFSRDRLSHSWPNGDQADFFVLWRTWYYRSTLLQRFSARRSSP